MKTELFIKNTSATHTVTPETENVEFNEATKNDLITTINSLNILTCYKELR